MSLALELKGVGLSYPMGWHLRGPRFVALRDINLRVQHGERIAVVGDNGSGKSTLLRVVGDLMQPDSGEVVRDHGPCQLLSLNLGFLPHLTGRQNVILSGLLQGFTREEIGDSMNAIRQFSELGEFFDAPFRTYSSGMRSRLGFSLAVELSPDILLIDEALGVGDASFQKKSRLALQRKLSSGVTVLVVSHNAPFLGETCSRAVWVEKGRLVMDGPIQDVLAQYAGSRRRAAGLSVPVTSAGTPQGN